MKEKSNQWKKSILFTTLFFMLGLCLLTPKFRTKAATGVWDGYENTDGTFTITGCSDTTNAELNIPSNIEGKTVTAAIVEEWRGSINYPNLTKIILPDTIKEFEWSNSPRLSSLQCTGTDLSSISVYGLENCPNLHVEAYVDMAMLHARDKVSPITYHLGTFHFRNSGVRAVNLKNVSHEDWNYYGAYGIAREFIGCKNLTAINVLSSTGNAILTSRDGVLFYNGMLAKYPAGKSTASDYTLPEDCTGFASCTFDDCSFTSITVPEHMQSFLLLNDPYGDSSSFYHGSYKFRIIQGHFGLYGTAEDIAAEFAAAHDKIDPSRIEFYRGSTYTISYNLNGGTNAPNNPTSYQAGDDIIELANPTREGYSFLGWKRNDISDRYENTTEIPFMSGFQNYIFTADWKKIETPPPASGNSNVLPSLVGTILKNVLGGNYKVIGDGLEVEYTKPSKSNIKSVTIPNTIQANGTTYRVTSIAPNAFKNDKKLATVKIGSSVTTIGANAFSGCQKLKKITLGSAITSIGAKSFYKCTSLTKITIPGRVEKIGKQAFSNCSKLKSIVIKSTKLTSKSVASNVFSKIYSRVSVKVPKKVFKAYEKLLRKKGLSSSAKIKK